MSAAGSGDLKISDGPVWAAVTTVGGGLRAFEVAGVPYVQGYPAGEQPPMGAGCVLVPWPNRVAGANWVHDGDALELEVTEPARGNAIHGLVRKAGWTVREHAASAITMEIAVGARPGWPFPFRATITYAVGPGGLTVTHGMTNDGTDPLPFGVGTHPYPRPGNAPLAECVLTSAATSSLPLDPERMVPTGPPVTVDGTEFDLRGGRRVADLDLDHAFGGCRPDPDGLIRHALRHADGGVELWAQECFGWVQVFTPRTFPGAPDGLAVAIEPMTCPPDALNSGADLIMLDPGDTWTGSWGITPLR